MKRVVQYLYHTRNHAITYFRDFHDVSNEQTAWEAGSHPLEWKLNPNERFKMFTDAAFGKDIATKRSTSGEIIFMNGGPISWFSRLQKLVAQSTAESEVYAAIDGVKVVAHLQILLHDLGVRDLSRVTTFFCCNIGSFDPLCVRSPLDTLESGVLFHIWWLSKQLLGLHDGPPWKVALCLPYPTVPSPPDHVSQGRSNQL